MGESREVRVWDVFVRLFHWTLVVGFAVCYLTEGKPRWLHVNSGYVIAALIPIRVLWGFVGPRHARFSDFVRGPRAVLGHLKEVATFKARRYLGHDPAGGAMVIALLVTVSLTVLSGMWLYGVKDKAGPFAGVRADVIENMPLIDRPAFASKAEKKWSQGGRVKDERVEWVEEAHEALAMISLVLVCLHIGGVLAVSFQTRENLVLSMITGRKKSTFP
jgi:cytochrome b